jgi:hypothetical protein
VLDHDTVTESDVPAVEPSGSVPATVAAYDLDLTCHAPVLIWVVHAEPNLHVSCTAWKDKGAVTSGRTNTAVDGLMRPWRCKVD